MFLLPTANEYCLNLLVFLLVSLNLSSVTGAGGANEAFKRASTSELKSARFVGSATLVLAFGFLGRLTRASMCRLCFLASADFAGSVGVGFSGVGNASP